MTEHFKGAEKSEIDFDLFLNQVLAFLRGDLKMTEYSFLKQVTLFCYETLIFFNKLFAISISLSAL